MSDFEAAEIAESQHTLEQAPMKFPAFCLLGIRLDGMTKTDICNVIVAAVKDHTRCIIANHNVHSLYFWSQEPRMRRFYAAADYIQIDGMPLVWLGRLFGIPLKPSYRTTNIDLLPLLAREAVCGKWRIFYLGSKPEVAKKATEALRAEYPGLQLLAHDGYFDMSPCGTDNQEVIKQIWDYGPDVLLVGMGMPRQEAWVEENLIRLPACTVICCGGLMDLVSGAIPTPPRWMGSLGVEWLFRLISQPARTWRRYLLEPWIIIFRIIAEYRRSGTLRLSPDGKEE